MSKAHGRASTTELISALRLRLLTTIEFMESRNDFPSGAAFRGAVEKAAAEADVRTLRILSREIDAVATLAIPPAERDGLDAVLKNRLGIDRQAERAAWGSRVAAALKRGSISSEVERRHLEDYAEMLEAEGDIEKLNEVRQLLSRR
jgi:hypothetical protein